MCGPNQTTPSYTCLSISNTRVMLECLKEAMYFFAGNDIDIQIRAAVHPAHWPEGVNALNDHMQTAAESSAVYLQVRNVPNAPGWMTRNPIRRTHHDRRTNRQTTDPSTRNTLPNWWNNRWTSSSYSSGALRIFDIHLKFTWRSEQSAIEDSSPLRRVVVLPNSGSALCRKTGCCCFSLARWGETLSKKEQARGRCTDSVMHIS